MTLANAISAMDGCTFHFRPGAAAAGTPMLTVNQAIPYSSAKPIHVDVARIGTAGTGQYALVTCSTAMTAPVDGSSVILHNVPDDRPVRTKLSSDGTTLYCIVGTNPFVLVIR